MDVTDCATATLPTDADRSSFVMRRLGDRDQVAACLFKNGWRSFEQPFPAYFYACARRYPGLIADVGANTGFYSLLGACAASANRVAAFEPDPAILAALGENLALSGVAEQVFMMPLALSSASGRATLYVPTQEHGLIETSSSLEAHFKAAHSETRDVEVETLDRVLGRTEFAGRRVTLVKIDVEGHERSVLAGAVTTVKTWRPILFIEVLSEEGAGVFNDFLQRHAYVDIPLFPTGAAPSPDGVHFQPTAWNHAFVPKEKAEDFVRIAI